MSIAFPGISAARLTVSASGSETSRAPKVDSPFPRVEDFLLHWDHGRSANILIAVRRNSVGK